MSIAEIIIIILAPSTTLLIISGFLYYRDKIKTKPVKTEGEIIAITSHTFDKESLLKELEKAVKEENYEKASQIRNRINKLENK